ncbi:MAG: hypothetical protein LBT73_02980 [Tannerellaceae bacterium]|jgi:hypothetical protein|nr:hypothetical protein [Tannerellaceae bacterium]
MESSSIIAENKRRISKLRASYDPEAGVGGDYVPRKEVDGGMRLPIDFMSTYEEYEKGSCTKEEMEEARMRHDFEYWAYKRIKIRGKGKGEDIPFKLNQAQRKLVKELEEMRRNGRPIRVVLLKARQWGGSTVVQVYMLWIQLMHKENWNSVICGTTEVQSTNILSIVRTALENYPSGKEKGLELKPFEGSSKHKRIPGRKSTIYISSSVQPDTIRSSDISMAHLTEVGLWQETSQKGPEDVVQSVMGSIQEAADTVVVLESTGKGSGSYFQQTWESSLHGGTKFRAVFVGWYETEQYSEAMSEDEYEPFIATMLPYEWELWKLGASLEGIKWYRAKASSPGMEDWRMRSEYPSKWEDAFESGGNQVFSQGDLLKCRRTCREPEWQGNIRGRTETGTEALQDLTLELGEEDGTQENKLLIWTMPCRYEDNFRDRYIITVDIGGRMSESDPTDILVLDRVELLEKGSEGRPEVVAEWHGHIDPDMMAWKAAQIGKLYWDGLLVIESNTAESKKLGGNPFESILDEIVRYYPNLYSRTSSQEIKSGYARRWGFHTNTNTKPLIVNHQVKLLREGGYIERNEEALDEFEVFELNGGKMEARVGSHDDRVMTRCIGNYICYTYPLVKASSSRKRVAGMLKGDQVRSLARF